MENKLFNFRPIVFVAVALILGIIIAFYAVVGNTFLLILISAILIAALAVYCCFSHSKYKFIISFVLMLSFSLGAIIITIPINKINSSIFNENAKVEGKIDSIKLIEENYYRIVLSDVYLNGKKTEFKLSFESDESFQIGDRLSFSAYVKSSSVEKDYNYSLVSGECYLAEYCDNIVVIDNSKSIFQLVNIRIKEIILNNCQSDNAGMLIALMLGETSFLQTSTLASYRFSGISHIFAVSGLHIGFVGLIFSTLFGLIGLKRFKKTIPTLIILIFYSGICGFSPSSIRAVIMFAVISISKNLGLKYDLLNSIALSAVITLLIMPNTLFTYGFILSYCSVLSIALLQKPFQRLFSFLPKGISDAIAISAAAFVGTLPIILQMFGYMSIITVFLNVLMLPVVTVLYVLNFIAVIMTAIFNYPFWFFVPNLIADMINTFMTGVELDRFVVLGSLDTFIFVLYYILIIMSSGRLNIKSNLQIASICSAPLLLLFLI